MRLGDVIDTALDMYDVCTGEGRGGKIYVDYYSAVTGTSPNPNPNPNPNSRPVYLESPDIETKGSE